MEELRVKNIARDEKCQNFPDEFSTGNIAMKKDGI
jgi:hypothetical protein